MFFNFVFKHSKALKVDEKVTQKEEKMLYSKETLSPPNNPSSCGGIQLSLGDQILFPRTKQLFYNVLHFCSKYFLVCKGLEAQCYMLDSMKHYKSLKYDFLLYFRFKLVRFHSNTSQTVSSSLVIPTATREVMITRVVIATILVWSGFPKVMQNFLLSHWLSKELFRRLPNLGRCF